MKKEMQSLKNPKSPELNARPAEMHGNGYNDFSNEKIDFEKILREIMA